MKKNINNIIITKATKKDVNDIAVLGSAVNEFEVSDQVVSFWPKEILNTCIDNDDNIILVAKKASDLIGFIIINYNHSLSKAIIENIFVHPNFRNKKIGEKLLEYSLKELQRMNCRYLCTLTDSGNDKAINFYLENGFTRGINCVWLDKVLDSTFKRDIS